MSLTDILKQLHAAGASVGDILEQFNKRAVAGALAIGANADTVERLRGSLEKQARTAKEVADIMRTSVASLGKQISTVMNTMGIEIFQIFEEDIRQALMNFLTSLRNIHQWVTSNEDSIRGFFAGLTEDLDDLWVVMKAVVKGVANVVKTFGDAEDAGRRIAQIIKVIIAYKLAMHIANLGLAMRQAIKTAGNFRAAMLGSANALNVYAAGIAAAYLALDILIEKENKRAEKKATFMEDPARMQQVIEHLKEIKRLEDDINIVQNAINAKAGDRARSVANIHIEVGKLKKKIEDISGGFSIDFGPGKSLLKEDLLREGIKQINARTEKERLAAEARKKIEEDIVKAAKKNYGSLIQSNDKDGKKSSEKFEKWMRDMWKRMDERGKEYWKRQANAYEIAWDFIEKEAEEGIKLYEAHLQRMKEEEERQKQVRQNSIDSIISSTKSLYSSVLDMHSIFNQDQLNQVEERIEEEEKAIERRYRMETAAAEGSAFRKSLAEQRYINKKIALEKKAEAERARAAKREKVINAFRATGDMLTGIIAVMRDTQGGVISRVAAGLAYGAIAGAYVAQLAALKLRHGTKSRAVVGFGGEGTDNIPVNLSPGEVVLSTGDVRRLGGHNMLKQKIDTGNSYTTNNNGVTVNIDTVIGTDRFVRDQLIPIMEQEMTR